MINQSHSELEDVPFLKENVGKFLSERNDCSNHVMLLSSALAVGGSERKTVRIANALALRGWRITIGYLNAPHTLRDNISSDVSVVFLDRKGRFSIGALRRLVAYVLKHRINTICCINLYPLLYAYMARIIYLVVPFKIIASINTTEFIGRKALRQMQLYAPILRRINKIIFGSKYQMDLWESRYRLDKSKCTYIYNGVDTNYFSNQNHDSYSINVRERLEISKTSVIVGSIGRFRKEKQYEMAIRACVELRVVRGMNACCLLVGGGPESPRLKNLVTELGCDQYVYLIDAAEDVRPYLAAMDIFVLCSVSETFSNAALEAMSMSLPVVIPRVGGCPEMVRTGETGFLYDSNNINQLVDCLYLLSANSELRSMMGRSARQYVIENYQFDLMLESYSNLLSVF